MNNFATFWQRLAASGIDRLVFLPLLLLQVKVGSASKSAALALAIPWVGLRLGYSIYGHGRFGKTIGKWVMGIRVARLTGERIGWREAWLRSSVEVLLATVGVVGWVIALASTADAEYYHVEFSRQLDNVSTHNPFWAVWARELDNWWFWSEIVTMLFNKKRRALHDFIAATIVVSDRSAPNPIPTAAEQAVADDPAAGKSE